MDITTKANNLITTSRFTKMDLAKELGLSRPTLDRRLSGEAPWKLLESKWIQHLTNK